MKRALLHFSVHTKAHQIAIATILASLLQGLLSQSGSFIFLFSPVRTLFQLELWRPFTALFIATSPLEVIFGALIIYSVGGMLEYRWRRKRFVAVSLGIPLLAECITLILTVLSPSTFYNSLYAGSHLIVTTQWIIFGLLAHFSHEMLNFWGTPVRGKTFALIGVGFVVLTAAFNGVLVVLPDLITVAACYLYMYQHRAFNLKRSLEVKYYEWKLRRLKTKNNFRVIKGFRDHTDFKEHGDDEEIDPKIH